MRRRLKQLRLERGYTINRMAEMIGVNPRAYVYYETGERNPSYKVLIKLEDMFGIPQRELLQNEEAEKAS